MQETWVWSLVWEDPTFRGATKPETQLSSLCSRAQKLQLLCPHAATTESKHPRACAPQQEKSVQCEVHTPQLDSSLTHPN